MKHEGILFIISAPSGAGKTSLCKEVIDIFKGLRHSVSFTTRQARPGEVHGRDYFFTDHDQFRQMVEAGEFAEWAEVHGNCYGTAIRTLEEYRNNSTDVILDIDCQGAQQLKQRFKSGVFIFILPPSFHELRKRLDLRKSDSKAVIERRIENAAAEIKESRWYDYIIVNDDFNEALEELQSIIRAERCRTGRVLESVSKMFNI
jgi:guanylate kinase